MVSSSPQNSVPGVADAGSSANSTVIRDANKDSGFRRVALDAVSGGLDNLGYERGGVYAAAATFTIDNQSVNGVTFLVTTGSSNRTGNLPAAASWTGQVIEVVKVDSGTGLLTIDPNASETLNGSTTVIIYEQYQSYRFRSDGSNWIMVGQYNPYEPQQQTITDPGNAGAIPVTRSGHCPIVTAGSETRTLAAPTFIGQELTLYIKTDGGTCVITVASAINQSSNNTVTMADVRDVIVLRAIESGSSKVWMVLANEGATLSTV